MSEQTIAFLFPGQGSQYPGIGSDLYQQYATVRETYEEANDIVGYDLAAMSFEDPDGSIDLTRHTQPVLLTHSVACLRFFGLRYPVIPLGYSHPRNLNLFLSTILEFSPEFSVKGEIENIFFSENRGAEVFYNLGFELNVVDLVTLGLDLKYSPSINRVVRVLKIGYTTQF